MNSSDRMTNDQFPMTNGGGRAGRAVRRLHGDPIRNWSFVIGIWSFPRLFANKFVNNPG
jgi:hypothetical protein